jgi:excisionase family DNA binding protein
MENSKSETRATMTVLELAKYVGLSKNSAYAAVKRGDFPKIVICGRILIPRAALDRMLAGAGKDAQ